MQAVANVSQVRCETDLDAGSGKYFLEIFYPVNADVPLVRSPANYGSHEEARAAALEMFERAGQQPEPAFPQTAPIRIEELEKPDPEDAAADSIEALGQTYTTAVMPQSLSPQNLGLTTSILRRFHR